MCRNFFAKHMHARATPTLPAVAATSAKSIVESLQNIANAEVQNQLPIARPTNMNSNAGARAHANTGFNINPRYVPGVAAPADPSKCAHAHVHNPNINESIALGGALESGNPLNSKRRWISDCDGDASIMDPNYVRAHAIVQASAHAYAARSITSSAAEFPDRYPSDDHDHDQMHAQADIDAFVHAHAHGHGYANLNANSFDHDYNI
jgi:hypothetical protein